LRELSKERLVGQLLARRLGDAEVNHLRHGHALVQRHEHVRRLEVAVDDALGVGVLDGAADLDEQLEAVARRQAVAVAVVGDGHAVHQLHHEVGPARVGGAGVQDAGNVLVVHQRQGLALGLEAGDDLAGVEARLDHLEGDLAPHRVLLFGHVHHAEAALADALEELVAADGGAGALDGSRDLDRCGLDGLLHRQHGGNQVVDPVGQVGMPGAVLGYGRVVARAVAAEEIFDQIGEDIVSRVAGGSGVRHGRSSVRPPGICDRISFSRPSARR
jgi:hypothetical protein